MSMLKIFFILVDWFKRLTGKQLLYITPNKYNGLGKTAVWCDLGFWYVGNIYDSADIAYGIAQNGVVEEADTSLVLDVLSNLKSKYENITVYDIGANTGYYSILSATKFGASVHAFEPLEEYVTCISESARINGVTNRVTTHRMALGSKKATIEITLSGSGSTLTKDFLGQSDLPTRMVPVETLDSLGLPAPHFIKIDVEAHEWEVLRGAQMIISKYKPVCFIEVAKTFSDRNFVHPHFADIMAFFDKQGYKIERNTSEGLVSLTEIPDGVSMYLCTPK